MLRIYLVDDDADDLENVCDAIESAGCAAELHLSSSISELQQKLNDPSHPRPNLIVLDNQTYGMTGEEAVEMLRNDQRFERTAIVIYSTHLTVAKQEDLKNKGADLCLTKGSTMDEIRSHVQAFCAAAEKRNGQNF